MKRFDFPLDRLLKVKRQVERLAELEQLKTREEADAARAHLRGLHDHLGRMAGQLVTSVGRPVPPTQWAAAAELTDRLGRQIEAAEAQVAAADQKALAASQERAQAAAEVEALTTLRQQQWDRWRLEVQRAGQEQLDDLGLRRWMAAREATPEAS